jgi:uncharacterized protein
MVQLVEQHRTQIEALCRTYRVKRLELFGSAARGDFDASRSDLDFLVEFEDLGWRGFFRRYMGLKLALEKLFERPVDLIQPEAATHPFIQVAHQHRRTLYAA